MNLNTYYMENITSYHSAETNSLCLNENPYYIPSSFLTMNAYGTISVSFPFSYSSLNTPFFILLYTTSGEGMVTIGDTCFTLKPNSLLFLPENSHHTLEIIRSKWTFDLIFFNGATAPSIYKAFMNENDSYVFNTFGDIRFLLSPLIDSIKEPLSNFYTQNIALNTLLLTIVDSIAKSKKPQSLPSYLLAIKENFEKNYHDTFSLSLLSKQYKISPYKICHEFSFYFHISPMQFLTKIRLTASTHLLINTNLHINEISEKIGFSSTNHFIRLFKKETGKTPLVYRKYFSK